MVKPKVLSGFRSAAHNHGDCINKALAAAERICAERAARLTRLRKQVLELVWRNHEPVGAYDILAHLRAERNRAAPPTVYRALEFLIEQGLIHRIESMNAFVGCGDPLRLHVGQFMICRQCNTVAELEDPDINRLVDERAQSLGFRVDRQTIEIIGLCDECDDA